MSASNQVDDPEQLLKALRDEVSARNPKQYPIQYATAQFHLGVTLIGMGDIDGAIHSLEQSAALFPADGLPVEHAKATNMLGVALRDGGYTNAAVEAFARAAEVFAAQDQPLELAAARFNHGLGLRELGQHDDARVAFAEALETFDEANARESATAAARELGATLLDLDQLDEAVTALERALDLAQRGGGRQALGAASNVLGIVQLQADRPAAARDAFEDASGAHPRSIRPEPYAMARANLAIACERLDDLDHARLTARQAIAVDAASSDVVALAQGVLDRVGDDPSALIRALDKQPQRRWVSIIREEMRRLLEMSPDGRQSQVDAWVDGLIERSENATDLAEAWFEVILELPPASMRTMTETIVVGLDDRDPQVDERLRAQISSAVVRFHVPQWMRLKDTLNDIATHRGQEPTWK